MAKLRDGKQVAFPSKPTTPPTPTPDAAQVRAEYPVLDDGWELAVRTGNYIGDQVAFTGRIFTIQVAPPGRIFEVGDVGSQSVSAVIKVFVAAPDGSEEAVYIGYNDDTTGMFEGTYITVYGNGAETQSGVNALGGQISRPLVIADLIDIA